MGDAFGQRDNTWLKTRSEEKKVTECSLRGRHYVDANSLFPARLSLHWAAARRRPPVPRGGAESTGNALAGAAPLV